MRMLRDHGHTLTEDGGRLPRRREEAAAPRRDVARSEASQGADSAKARRPVRIGQRAKGVSQSRLIETADDVLEMTSFVQDPRSVASGLGSV